MPEPVLLTVSGTIPVDIEEQVRQGKRPQADYLALAKRFHADLLDVSAARQRAGWLGRLLERVGGSPLLLAWVCFTIRRQYRVIFTDGEQVGIPLAFFLKFFARGHRPVHLMIAHILSVGKKQIFFDLFGLHTHIDTFFVYSTWQKHFIEQRWKIAGERVIFTPFMVDDTFFSPARGNPGNLPFINKDGRPVICSAGLEQRDYSTLMDAVEGLNVQMVIAAASPWSKRSDSTHRRTIPSNVEVVKLSQFELRDLYAASQFVIMPLIPVNFQAGVTAILEALAMEKAVLCSLIPGQTDVIQENVNGHYVRVGDAPALRHAILEMLEAREDVQRMGQRGRYLVEEQMSLAHYTERLAKYVESDIN